MSIGIFDLKLKFVQGGPEFIVQTLRVGTGHGNSHLLYKNAWLQMRL